MKFDSAGSLSCEYHSIPQKIDSQSETEKTRKPAMPANFVG